ncbi:hypothetical protein GCM10023081_32630 [Arthrobacter ginkgonis]|uniref:Uncharacterized protein n=1 Tax=Arthrobacter ginkgonis TaxID=1630594 RepID=A0ABP7CQT9_9MICC
MAGRTPPLFSIIPGDPLTNHITSTLPPEETGATPAGPPPSHLPASAARTPFRARINRADLFVDALALAVYLVTVNDLFFVGGYFFTGGTGGSRIPFTEYPILMVLGILTVVGILGSAAMRLTGTATPLITWGARTAPAALLTLMIWVYTLGMFIPGVENSADPGFGAAFTGMLAFAALAAGPRNTETDRIPTRRWAWGAGALLALLTLANVLAALGADTANTAAITVSVLSSVAHAAVVAILLYLPVPGGRQALAFTAAVLALLWIAQFTLENNFQHLGRDQPMGNYQFWLPASALAFGFVRKRTAPRAHATGAAALIGLFGAASVLQLVLVFTGVIDSTLFVWAPVLSGIAAGVFLVQRAAARRARLMPGLAVIAGLQIVLLAYAASGSILSVGGIGRSMGLALAFSILSLVAIYRLDRDASLPVLTDRLAATVPAEQVAAATGIANRQAAGVFAGLSWLTGPVGILFGMLALGRADLAESTGLHTTAIRMIAGAGVALGVASAIFAYGWLTIAASR